MSMVVMCMFGMSMFGESMFGHFVQSIRRSFTEVFSGRKSSKFREEKLRIEKRSSYQSDFIHLSAGIPAGANLQEPCSSAG
jgi:hypothetical protein